MREPYPDKVTAAVRTTNSFIYGTSTLLGQEGSLDYLLAVREYVQERITKEADSWRPIAEQKKQDTARETQREIKEYTDGLQRRAKEQSLETRQLLSMCGLPTLGDLALSARKGYRGIRGQ